VVTTFGNNKMLRYKFPKNKKFNVNSIAQIDGVYNFSLNAF